VKVSKSEHAYYIAIPNDSTQYVLVSVGLLSSMPDYSQDKSYG